MTFLWIKISKTIRDRFPWNAGTLGFLSPLPCRHVQLSLVLWRVDSVKSVLTFCWLCCVCSESEKFMAPGDISVQNWTAWAVAGALLTQELSWPRSSLLGSRSWKLKSQSQQKNSFPKQGSARGGHRDFLLQIRHNLHSQDIFYQCCRWAEWKTEFCWCCCSLLWYCCWGQKFLAP